MYRRLPGPAPRRATLDPHDTVGLWSTALWIVAAAILLATFSIH